MDAWTMNRIAQIADELGMGSRIEGCSIAVEASFPEELTDEQKEWITSRELSVSEPRTGDDGRAHYTLRIGMHIVGEDAS